MVGEVNRAVGGIGTLGFVQEGKCVSSRHYDILSSRNRSSQIATVYTVSSNGTQQVVIPAVLSSQRAGAF